MGDLSCLESYQELDLINLNNKIEQIGLSVHEVQEKPNLSDEFQIVLEG